MDTTWQTETDLRLNALQRQLRSTRKLATALGVVVIALVAWTVVAEVRRPGEVALVKGDQSLTLDAGGVHLVSPLGSVTIDSSGIAVRDHAGQRATHLEPGELTASVDRGGMITLFALPDHASFTMLASDSHAAIEVGKSTATMGISFPHDHSISLEASDTSTKLVGLGPNYFELGGDRTILPGPPAK